jgi:DNA-binding MarR family transcriptional regulator
MARYRDNAARHLLGVARHGQATIMHSLAVDGGHRNLRLSFEPYVSLLASGDLRLSEIASTLGVSRQAAQQVIDMVQAAGYISRRSDPVDGRAKRITLTARGRQLIDDGIRAADTLERHYAALVGETALAQATGTLVRLAAALELPLPGATTSHGTASLSALLPRLGDHVMRRLMALTMARGHTDLKLSFGQVLTLIGPQGGRIQHIAGVQQVSKQAISAIAVELERLGYLRRETDAGDARQVVLQFTPAGIALIADSVASVADLETEYEMLLGRRGWAQASSLMQQLYRALDLEQDIFSAGPERNIDALARQLRLELGRHSARALGELLLNAEPV